ncbi:MAG: hypothetical protein QGG39_07750 [Candidatus Poribacteria bacterium]|nr:hypothetical protein [Candidatus Poribacteria bacterium]
MSPEQALEYQRTAQDIFSDAKEYLMGLVEVFSILQEMAKGQFRYP